uniref:CMP-sialic acid transporter 1 n=1 Tax=Lygus hesperus TaxID=30085 RepID=A0A0A9XRS3_LYGHE
MIHPLIKDMFPTTLSLALFILYISLFVNQGWLVTASQNSNNSYSYSTAVAVLLAEILKLIASIFIYAFKYPVFGLFTELKNNSKVFALYLIPASLYCLYNNLSFVNLSRFDPTTYFVVLQLRVVVTGVIFQILFKKQLSQKQWVSLFLLTFGCMVKQINWGRR